MHEIMLSTMISLFVSYQRLCSCYVNIICELFKCYSRDIIVCVLIDAGNSDIM